jgi:hypothetical protein
LRQARVFTDLVRLFDVRDQTVAASTSDILDARVDREFRGNQISVYSVTESFPRGFRRPVCV